MNESKQERGEKRAPTNTYIEGSTEKCAELIIKECTDFSII
jgi:hypothetical protein